MLTSTRSRRMPALFTRMCRSPKASRAVWMSRCPPSHSATLSALATASPPMALISSTTCWAGVRSSPDPSMAPPRSLMTTLAPSWANSRACSRPIPRPEPVIMATRPSSAPIAFSFRSAVRATLFGVEVDARPTLDLGTRFGVGVEDALARRTEDVGYAKARCLQRGLGLLDALALDIGHGDKVLALRHRDGHLAPLGDRRTRGRRGADHLILRNRV